MSEPPAWTRCLLGDVTYEVADRIGCHSGSLPVYGVDRSAGLTGATKYQSEDLSRYKSIQPGMFAYNPMRLNIGSIGYCSNRHAPGLVSPDYVVFGCHRARLVSDFLDWYTRGPFWGKWTETAGVGSVRVRIYYRELARMPITIPPLKEQQAIACILGALDDKMELNRRMNQTLEAMARAIFKSWFVDFDPVRAKAAGKQPPGLKPDIAALFPDAFEESTLGEIPRGWTPCRWGDIASLEYGKSLRDYSQAQGPFQVFGTNGPIGRHTEPLWNGAGIIIGRKGAYRGVHYSPEPFFVIDTAFYLKPRAEIDMKWAYYELLRLDINGMDSGSAIPSTSRSDFYAIPVCLPSQEVLRAYGMTLQPIYDRKDANGRENNILAALRDALLPKLISGELRVPDAERIIEQALDAGLMPPSTAPNTPAVVQPVASLPKDQPQPSRDTSQDDDGEEPEARPTIENYSREDVLAVIRELYHDDPAPCDREELLVLLRDRLGFGALGARIREYLEGDLLAAVRRGVLERRLDGYGLYCRTIDDYGRDYLKNLFLQAIGRGWVEREEAMQQAARYLGFRRMGRNIQAALKSVINGLIREGRIEADGSTIRRA